MQSLRAPLARHAGVAQLVEQLTCNEKVEGSIPFTGTISTQQKAQPNGRAFCILNLGRSLIRCPTDSGRYRLSPAPATY